MARHERPGPTVALDEARHQLLSALRRLEPREVPLDEAVGRALGEAIIATEDVPPFANSAMDGFAVRAEDTRTPPARLRLVGAATAGNPATAPLGPGEAMVIATGAPVPKGADAVCMLEHTAVEGTEVVLDTVVDREQNVRYPGDDISRGDLVFEPSTVLGPAHIGVLASLGVTTLSSIPSRGSACWRPVTSCTTVLVPSSPARFTNPTGTHFAQRCDRPIAWPVTWGWWETTKRRSPGLWNVDRAPVTPSSLPEVSVSAPPTT